MDLNNWFCLVVSAILGDHSLLVAGTVDCYDEGRNEYVQLKTRAAKFEHPGKEKTFRRHKTRDWWLQSHLLGIKRIYCGLRDENGIVEESEWYTTEELPHGAIEWEPSVCLAYLDKFLTEMKRGVTEELVPYATEFSVSRDEAGTYKFLPCWMSNN